ncbi:MAG: hypothetical protein GWP91_12495 [Rhodobacterales bacterium]|nr:hypothetical protein [Rhodobacterales bacterium]
MDWNSKQTHQQLGAWFNGLYALFNLASAAIIFLVFGGLGALFAGIGVTTFSPPLVIFGGGFVIFGLLITVLVAVPFVLNFVTAIGLAWYPDEMWTTVVSVIGALIAIPVFPIGTMLGCHTLGVVLWEPLAESRANNKVARPKLVSA